MNRKELTITGITFDFSDKDSLTFYWDDNDALEHGGSWFCSELLPSINNRDKKIKLIQELLKDDFWVSFSELVKLNN